MEKCVNEQKYWNSLYLELLEVIKQLEEEYKANPTRENRDKLREYFKEQKEYLKVLGTLNTQEFNYVYYNAIDKKTKIQYLKSRLALLEKVKGKKVLINTEHGKVNIAKNVKSEYLKYLNMLNSLEIKPVDKKNISKEENTEVNRKFKVVRNPEKIKKAEIKKVEKKVTKEKQVKKIINDNLKVKVTEYIEKTKKSILAKKNLIHKTTEKIKNKLASNKRVVKENLKTIGKKITNSKNTILENFKNFKNKNIVNFKREVLRLALSLGCAMTLTSTTSNVSALVNDLNNENIEYNIDDACKELENKEIIVEEITAVEDTIEIEEIKEETSEEVVETPVEEMVEESVKVKQETPIEENTISDNGLLAVESLDFDRIANSAENAKNKNFINVKHPEYWGDEAPLSYKINNEAVYVYEGSTLLGFTDLEGIGVKDNTIIEEQEEIEEEVIEVEDTSDITVIDASDLQAGINSYTLEELKEMAEYYKQMYYQNTLASSENLVENMYGLTEEQLDITCAVIRHEAGNNLEEIAAVASVVKNRMNDGNWGGTDPYSVVTAKGQFESYLKGYYEKYLHNLDDETIQVINDILSGNVEVMHNYRSFRSNGSTSYSNNMFTSRGNRYR